MTAGSCPISVCGKTTPIFTMALRRLTRRSLPAGPAPVDDEAPPSYKGARPTGPRARQLERGQAMKQVLAVVLLLHLLVITGQLDVVAQPRPPIKIGFTADLTGIAAQPAKDMVN